MWELYDRLIENIDPNARAERVCQGNWRAFVESDGNAGLASLLRGCPGSTPAAALSDYEGMSLREMAALCKSWDPLESALGIAAMNAWYNRREMLEAAGAEIFSAGMKQGDAFRTLLPRIKGKKVATIGHFRGVRELYQEHCELYIFEREPKEGDLPDAAEEYLLQEMDVVFTTGMTFTNKTLPRILQLAQNAYVVLTGPSVPMCPLLQNFGVDLLSGTVVLDVPGCRQGVMQEEVDYFPYTGKVLLEL